MLVFAVLAKFRSQTGRRCGPKWGLWGVYLSNPDPQAWGVGTVAPEGVKGTGNWLISIQICLRYIYDSHFSGLLTSGCLRGIHPARASRAAASSSKGKTMNE